MSDRTQAPDAPDNATADDEWETISTGLGKELELAEGAHWIGFYVEKVEVELPEETAAKMDRKTATAHIFADLIGEQRFAWASHELDTALVNVERGEKVRVTFLGRDSFTGADGPRQIKRYKVERAKR